MIHNQTSQKYTHLTSPIHQMPINLYAVYRILNSSVISFCETLSNILTENIVTNHARPILLGDFNIHTDKQDNPDTITFLDFLDSLNFVNKVNFPTLTSGHMLDLIIEDKGLQLLSDVQCGFLLSDHHFILSKLLIANQHLLLKKLPQDNSRRLTAVSFKQTSQNHSRLLAMMTTSKILFVNTIRNLRTYWTIMHLLQ